jgi:glycosyltransferase involved in cell wall biosynthesis/nucleoside-diphosphate-sugar epimerase
MKLLVTGASGFLGRYVVAEAVRRGHAVRAVVRGCGDGLDREAEIVRADLRSRRGLVDAVRGVDAVIHLAATKSGDVYAQYAGTVVATENLLWAIEQVGGVKRFVHISSFSVYDYTKPWAWSTLDEDSPVETDAMNRDGYAHTKLVQEQLVRDACAENGWSLVVIRPGMIYGRGNLFNAFCGLEAGPKLWLRVGALSPLSLTYVENVAEAIVLAAERDEAAGQTVNIVDDDLPSRRRYVKLLQERSPARPRVVPVPWIAMRFLAWAASTTNTVLLRGRAKLPGLFIPCRLHARFKSLRYSNALAKRALGWEPRYDLETAVARSVNDEEGQPSRLSASPKVAYLTGEYPRATDTFIQREVAQLRASGIDVETFSVRVPALKENVGPEQLAERQRTFYLLPARPLDLLRSHASLLFKSPARWFGALKLAWRARAPGLKSTLLQLAYFAEAGLVARRMRERNIAHLHNHFADSSCSVAMLASHLGGFPYSFTIHGPAEFFEPRRWRLDEKVKRAAFVVCISRFCRSQMMCFSREADWHKLKVVHCGVNPADFQPVEHRGFGHRMLFVGRLAGVKGLPVLLEALAAIRRDRPNVVLQIAGDGSEREKLESLAARLGVSQNVKFLGYQTQAQVRALLCETDVFVMASFAEGVPVVLMEAMAAGVTVVTTNVAGIPELVDDGASGLLVPPGDAESLAKRVAKLLGDPELRARFARAGRAKVEREFNLAMEVERLRHTLVESLAGRDVATRPDCGSAQTPAQEAVVKCA